MRIAQIRSIDISDGPGVRVAIYTQGCPIHCKNCHNQSIWDFNGGSEYDSSMQYKILNLCGVDYIKGLSILGGEPFFEPNLVSLAALVYAFKIKYPNKNIWIWSGYTFEQLLEKYMNNIWFRQILEYTDVIVDGPYIEEQKDLNLKYSGSKNQRVIDVKKTLNGKKLVLINQ